MSGGGPAGGNEQTPRPGRARRATARSPRSKGGLDRSEVAFAAGSRVSVERDDSRIAPLELRVSSGPEAELVEVERPPGSGEGRPRPALDEISAPSRD